MIDHISRIPLDFKYGATVFVFGDLQWGASGFSREAWEEFRHRFKTTKNAWALGIGDYGDYVRPSMRGRIIAAASHDDSVRAQMDDQVRRNQDKLLDEMQFLDKKLIGLHEGHHCWEFADRTKSDQRIASALHAPFLGWIASTRLILASKKGDRNLGAGHVYTMISTHGNANARRTGGATGWMENNIMTGFVADQYIMGHCCKSITWEPVKRNTVRRNGPAGMDVTIPRCLQVGGFHEGYTNGWESSYVEHFGFQPQPIGWGVIEFKLVSRKADSIDKGVSRGTKTLDVKQYSQTWRP